VARFKDRLAFSVVYRGGVASDRSSVRLPAHFLHHLLFLATNASCCGQSLCHFDGIGDRGSEPARMGRPECRPERRFFPHRAAFATGPLPVSTKNSRTFVKVNLILNLTAIKRPLQTLDLASILYPARSSFGKDYRASPFNLNC
jgi:hypothetical protein